ncbi:MAG: MerR family transcriptional regulator [Deltaproteobacteria bacterium]|nr:MAG: MerR family transcriptional regulator [Deltaproteobacteria bacterium]
MSRKPTKVKPPTAAEDLPDKVYFRIGEASDLIGVEAHVLRYWETEFGLKPHRTPSGQRRYRREDVELLLKVRRLLHEQGFTIAGARKALSGQPADDDEGVDAGVAREVAEQLERARKRLAALRSELERPLAE